MSLHWYACISINTYCYEIYYILLEIFWWALSNTSLIVWICSAAHEILANKAFTVTDDLISQLFVVTFVHPTYVQIALIWGFPVQPSLWESVHWLWRYKVNEVCDSVIYKSTCPENYIPVVMPPLNHTSPPSMAATFLATCLMAVLQPSGYSVFHDRDTPIQLGLP